MSAPLSASSVTAEIVLLLLIVFVLVRRTYGMVQGTRYSAPRLFVFAGFYVVLFVALAVATLYAAISTWGSNAYLLIPAYTALPIAAAWAVAPYVQKIVRFERRDDQEWYYRLAWHIPALYLSLFIARFVAEIVVFGPSAAFAFPPPAPPSGAALWILIGVDLLFAVSLGLLVGRGIGVYQAHQALPPVSVASPPLPSAPEVGPPRP